MVLCGEGGQEAQAVPKLRNTRCNGYSSIPGCNRHITHQPVSPTLSKFLFTHGAVSKHPELLQGCEETLLSEKPYRWWSKQGRRLYSERRKPGWCILKARRHPQRYHALTYGSYSTLIIILRAEIQPTQEKSVFIPYPVTLVPFSSSPKQELYHCLFFPLGATPLISLVAGTGSTCLRGQPQLPSLGCIGGRFGSTISYWLELQLLSCFRS